jgi:hypothetical protein
MKFDRPYVYLGKDAFLWEVRYTANTSTANYPFDFQYVGTSSTYNSNSGTVLGTGCTATGRTSPATLSMTWYNYGNKFKYTRSVYNMPANSPVILFMDFMNSNLSVPGLCTTLYAMPTLVITGGTPTSSTGSASQTVDNIPHVPGLGGAKLYFQALCLDSAQPGFPFALSYGREITFPNDVLPPQVIRNYHYKISAAGSLVTSGPWNGGIITRFGP